MAEITIPQVIHYCWFGGKPLPRNAEKCIASWRKYYPDFEIRRWDESNFDVNIIPFTAEAYSAKKFAYVSDYARLRILYRLGGYYFDTDVEAVKRLPDAIREEPFMGIEKSTLPNHRFKVNPGLGFSSRPGSPLLAEIMGHYENMHYLTPAGINQITIVPITTAVLEKYGFDGTNRLQDAGDFRIYPYDYFCPIEYPLGKIEITPNTCTIHHYTESWMSPTDKLRMRLYAWLDTPMGSKFKTVIKSITR
ncbi:glycosyltransferase family 32 protein [Alistipes sp.]|uniref:glycosyltransferase family 32 protein n=1 Tax=Alistipes sp. TaxID=1872444 RepID=UPI003AF1934F